VRLASNKLLLFLDVSTSCCLIYFIARMHFRLKRSSINSNSKRNEVPSESVLQLYRNGKRSEIGTSSHADFTHNKQFRQELAKTCERTQNSEKLMYNFRRVYKERQWLKVTLK
jgi:hypothetical protein